MVNLLSIDEVVRLHGTGKIRMIDTISSTNSKVYEKDYKCDILNDLGNHIIRISMPSEYGEYVPLPLDSHYEMFIETRMGDFIARGIIVKRYRNEQGNVMDFKLTKPLSYVDSLKFPIIKTNIQASYSDQSAAGKKIGNIVSISMNNIVMETSEILEEDSKLDIVFSIDGGENIVCSGEVKESIRIKSQQFESYIILKNNDAMMDEKIAKWMLKNS